MTVKNNKAARKAIARVPSAKAQAETLTTVGNVAYDTASQGRAGQARCDAAILAALKGCDSDARRKAVGEAFKVAFAAALLTTCSNNLPMAARVKYAESLKAMAPGPVRDAAGKITAPTGTLKKGQKRRTLEQQADWRKAHEVNAAKIWSRTLERLGLKATNPVGASSAKSKAAKAKAAKAKAEAETKGAVIPLAKVARYMPPARKDLTPAKLAAFIVQCGQNMQTALDEAVQSFDKSGTQTSGLVALASAVADFREAANKAAKAVG